VRCARAAGPRWRYRKKPSCKLSRILRAVRESKGADIEVSEEAILKGV
jgi:hypothetical protein